MSGAKSSILMPASILVGAGIVATGLYLGLRSTSAAPPVPPASVPAASGMSAAPTSEPAAAPLQPEPTERPIPSALLPPQGQAERQAAASSAALAHLADRKRALVATCWDPSVAKNAAPATARFRVRFLMNATGKVTTAAVAGPTDGARQDVAGCLQEQLASAVLAAPGADVGVEVALELP